MKIDKISLDNYITGNYGEIYHLKEETIMQPKRIINSMKVKVIEEDMLKIMDKLDDLEQMIFNQGAKQRDNYKLVNDRIDEAFDVIKMLERRE